MKERVTVMSCCVGLQLVSSYFFSLVTEGFLALLFVCVCVRRCSPCHLTPTAYLSHDSPFWSLRATPLLLPLLTEPFSDLNGASLPLSHGRSASVELTHTRIHTFTVSVTYSPSLRILLNYCVRGCHGNDMAFL